MIETLPPNGIGVMDRGFAGLKFLQKILQSKKYFVLRIGNKYKLEFDEESGLTRVGTGEGQGLYRVVNFCCLENRAEFPLVTNLPEEGETAITDEEVIEIYRECAAPRVKPRGWQHEIGLKPARHAQALAVVA